MTVADQIARWLHEKGITTTFGIIGGGNVALWDAIARLAKTELVCVHHEQSAAMAATYYYRTSGRLAVALVTTGAGSANAITGVLAAWMDSVPLLVISGNEASKYMGAETRVLGVQGYQSAPLVRPITKGWVQVTHAGWVIRYLDDMYRTVLRPRRGPCWVDIPKDIQNAAV